MLSDRVLSRLGLAGLFALYFLMWGVISLLPLNPTDLDVFFFPSARIAAGGHPLLVYSLLYAQVYPNANGPLSLVPLTGVVLLTQHLGWAQNPALSRMLADVVFAVFPLLMVWEVLRALDRLLPAPIKTRWRVPIAALFALSPLLFQSMLLYGHIEHAIMLWLLLASVRFLGERRYAVAGLVFGLALLTRSSVVVYAVPLVGVLLLHRRWRQTLAFGLSAGGTLGLGLSPFLLADRKDVIFSLFTFHAQLDIGGGSLWGIVMDTPLATLGQRYDTEAVLLAAALATAATLAFARRLDFDSPHLYALLMLCGCCFALFIKTLWPYYFLDDYVLVSIWWIALAGRLATWRARLVFALGVALPAALVLLGQVVDSGISMRLPDPQWRVYSLWYSVAIALFAAAVTVIWALVARRERAGQTPDSVTYSISVVESIM